MSWTDVFPTLTDDQLDEFQTKATDAELEELENWFGIARTVNRREGPHVVAASLFWKPAVLGAAAVPKPSRHAMIHAAALGIQGRFPPWEHYVLPLLEGAELVREKRPDIVFRVYLAADMEFLLEDLVALGCEVCVMKSSSLALNPGAMWRFLGFEEEGRIVTVTDSDRAREVLNDVERTEHAHAAGLGGWRVPYAGGGNDLREHPGYYHPFLACHFGACLTLPMRQLMFAFVWHTLRGTMPDRCVVQTVQPGTNLLESTDLPIYGTRWPDYGYDEWFLRAAFYPRLALEGILTFRSWNESLNHWFVLDIEYVTWANPKSEILYFGRPKFLEFAEQGGRPPAQSAILPQLVQEKLQRQKPSITVVPTPKEPLTLVVARYNENVNWLLDLQPEVRIVLYNKGVKITDPRLLERIDHLETIPNQGREADTYLYHLETADLPTCREWTVFCQGDPFPHSPNFPELLDYRDSWADVQPLTSAYKADQNIPPWTFQLVSGEGRVGHLPVYMEQFSLHTMDTLGWIDEGVTLIFNDYRSHFSLEKGWSITGHFLESCGLMELAEQAWRNSLGQFGYGAQFGVRNERLTMIPKDCLPRMRKISWDHHTAGYAFEKLWLHLFGVPFTKPPRVDLHGDPIDSPDTVA